MSELLPLAAIPATGQYTARITSDDGAERLFVGARTALAAVLRTETDAKPAEAERLFDGFEHLERFGTAVKVEPIDDLFAAAGCPPTRRGRAGGIGGGCGWSCTPCGTASMPVPLGVVVDRSFAVARPSIFVTVS